MSVRKLALLRGFFEFLDTSGVRWCVVGDHRDLHVNVASDVDIVVDRTDVRRVVDLVRSFARRSGIWLVQDIQHEIVARYFVYAWSDDQGGIEFLHVDICGDYYRRGRRFLDASYLLENRIEQRRIMADGAGMTLRMPSPERNFVYYLLKKIDKSAVNDEQCEFLSSEFAAAPGSPDLDGFFSAESRSSIERAAREGDWSPVHARIGQLRDELRASPRISRRRLFREAARGALRMARPTGVLIAYTGSSPEAFAGIVGRVATTWIKAFRNFTVVEADGEIGRSFYRTSIRRHLVHSSAVVLRSRVVPRWPAERSFLAVDDGDGRDLHGFDLRMSGFLRERLSERDLGIYLSC